MGWVQRREAGREAADPLSHDGGGAERMVWGVGGGEVRGSALRDRVHSGSLGLVDARDVKGPSRTRGKV